MLGNVVLVVLGLLAGWNVCDRLEEKRREVWDLLNEKLLWVIW